jgi:hypothetical protein
MEDAGFLEPLRDVLSSADRFGHREHVSLAWRYTALADRQTAERWMCQAIHHLASAHGMPEKYHETLTIAWTRIVGAHLRPEGRASFDEFITCHPALLNKGLPERHFSRELLWSDGARARWVEPDLQPLPRGPLP